MTWAWGEVGVTNDNSCKIRKCGAYEMKFEGEVRFEELERG